MLSLSVAQPTNPVVGDLRATGSQTFSFLEAALDEVPEVVLSRGLPVQVEQHTVHGSNPQHSANHGKHIRK